MTKKEVVWAELSCMYSMSYKSASEKQDEYTDKIVSDIVEDDEIALAIKHSTERYIP
jgi:hypothetical protein